MNNVCLVDISNSLEYLSQQIGDDVRLAYLLLFEEGHQVLTRKILKNGDEKSLLLVELLKFIDIFAVDKPQYLAFFQNKSFGASLVLVLFIDDLGRKLLLVGKISHMIDLP